MNKQRKRGYSITSQGQVLIEQKRQEKGYTREKLAEVAGISIDTLKSLQRGENKDKKTIEAIVDVLGIQPIDIVDPHEWYPQSENKVKDESNIYSMDICHKMLDKQQEQQNNRRKASSMGHEVDVHVPFGLVERKQQQRRNENVEKEDIYKLESEVITKTYQHDEFLQEIINKGDQRKNKHIAIVGEPGAGKTTLLNAIATYIKEKTQNLPIFISLGSLQGMTLTDYVIKKWLPDASRLVNGNAVINTELEEQFKSEFYQGKFWLLLDGVDEMGESSPIQALNKIAQELTNWLGQAKVILTCRLNVWDATVNNNILPGFTTFKTQEFTPEDVEKFIRDWFAKANKINHGEKLILQLRQEGKERIRELVTNPLRLSLLCQIFDQDENGELPETKAQFYQLFTRYFYEWKPELVPDLITSYELREKLHQGLGNLALAGINSDVRFRLKRSFAVKAMGDERLFNLACEVGWLNQVDRDAVSDEDVYAFFHANFQEYFAALVIDDWSYFLNHNNANPNPFVQHNNQDCVYRIFEDKWKEVILLWIGRQDILPNIKDEFMNELSKFEDGCDFEYDCPNIWKYNLFAIAKECLREFTDCSLKTVICDCEDEVVTVFDNIWESDLYDWIMRYNLDCMRSSSQREEIRKSLINKLGIWMHYSAEEDDDFGFHTFKVMYDEYEKSKEIIKQREIDYQEEVKWINTAKVTAIVKKLSLNNDQFIRGAIINRLIQIFSEDNTEVVNIYREINSNLNDNNDDFLESLIYILHQSEYYDDLEIVKICMQILNKSRNKTTIIAALDYLYDISLYQTSPVGVIEEIVRVLNKKYFQFLFKNNCKDRYWYCYEILLNCSSKMIYPEFYHAWHGNTPTIQTLENQFTDTHSLLTQLQPTNKTYPLPLNLKTLQNETDIIEISQEICNQIYLTAFTEPEEIPTVITAPQLKSKIPQIKKHLKTENLALIINNCEPNETIINFLNKLTDVLHIAFITEQPLNPPLRGFPQQQNLLNTIQNWINEIE
jgi:transcriptional regulator with XRE-family HTH domain